VEVKKHCSRSCFRSGAEQNFKTFRRHLLPRIVQLKCNPGYDEASNSGGSERWRRECARRRRARSKAPKFNHQPAILSLIYTPRSLVLSILSLIHPHSTQSSTPNVLSTVRPQPHLSSDLSVLSPVRPKLYPSLAPLRPQPHSVLSSCSSNPPHSSLSDLYPFGRAFCFRGQS
jgi:hypothetical protein